jgi:threonine/homoserine/homoserine lactone efflux protein
MGFPAPTTLHVLLERDWPRLDSLSAMQAVDSWHDNWLMLLVAAACLVVLMTVTVLSRGTLRRPSHGKTIDRVAGIVGILGALVALGVLLWLCL